MRVRIWMCLLLLSWMGCSDNMNLPDRECDASRRCTFVDAPVCGADGVEYECASVMNCMGVEAAADPTVCGGAGPGCATVDCAPGCSMDGTNVDERGCPTCTCDDCPPVGECDAPELVDGCWHCPGDNNGTECAPVGCRLYCENGFKLDADGCEICECVDEVQPCPAIACADGSIPIYDDAGCLVDCEPPVECEPVPDVDDWCTNPGCRIATDPNGCETCECSDGVCPRFFCDIYCEHGYLTDGEGCPTCQCYEPCSQLPECDLFCPTGNTVDPENGCFNSCECRNDQCSPVTCALACSNGFRRDSSGCEVCECRAAPCTSDEQCAFDEHCVFDPWAVADADGLLAGECLKLEVCGPNTDCPDGAPCGFYYRTDCCPPATSCPGNMPECPAVCLL